MDWGVGCCINRGGSSGRFADRSVETARGRRTVGGMITTARRIRIAAHERHLLQFSFLRVFVILI